MEPPANLPVAPESQPASLIDVAVGVTALTVGAVAAVTRHATSAAKPAARAVLNPPMLPVRLRPGRWLGPLGRLGATQRLRLRREVSRLLDALVPVTVEELARRAALTTVVTRYVDLDRVVGEVDLDAAAERIDVDAIARRLDLDAVLDRLNLTAVVMQRVDLDAVIQAILDRIDLASLAEQVVDAVDLPEIIRESTGSMASDTVQGARMRGIVADEVVGRVRNRLLRRDRHPVAATGPGVAVDEGVVPSSHDRSGR